MSLLREIQAGAVDSNSDLGALLRKCKILAGRLGSRPLEQWLIWESGGYPGGVDLPTYRTWPLEFKGHFVDRFTSRIIKYQAIPIPCLPDNVRDACSSFSCRQSVASIEETLKTRKSDTLQIRMDDLALLLSDRVIGGSDCVLALAEFSTGYYVEALNAVRNRLLDFVIAVEREEPNAGDVPASEAKITAEKATQLFQMTVYQNGDFYMGDHYQAGQAGAMGPSAHAQNMYFQQVWSQHGESIDLGQLQTELAVLRKSLTEAASDPDHEVAVGNVAAAEKAAAAGDGPKALGYLKNAGKWSLCVATKIGVPVAAAAIKAALGL